MKGLLCLSVLMSCYFDANARHLMATKSGADKLSSQQPMSAVVALKSLREDVKTCEKLSGDSTLHCLKSESLQLFDTIMTADVINVWNGVRLVLDQNASRNASNDLERKDLQHLSWFDHLTVRLAKTLTTHTLQVNLKAVTDAYMQALERKANVSTLTDRDAVGTARLRRHRYNMLMTMMFGATALGAVLVPMGFQLLSIVSGKALLLAKMALLLASINGLKRVANSGVHYGLYHVPSEHLSGYYDRGDTHHPRNVMSVPLAQNMEFGLK